MRRLRVILLFILVIVSMGASGQKIHVKASGESLSSVVKRLNAEVSFDNRILSRYKITVDQYFPSPAQAIAYLLKGKPLQVKKVAGVYIITEKKQKPVTTEKATEEKYREKPAAAHPVDKSQDTLGVNLSMSLKEIVITANNHTPYLNGEETDGSSRFRSFTANAMPGYSDNSVFNVLRMMPGIRASGEPSDELYVWGSSPGESRVYLDGIPLFSMQSYNSNISYINPYMSDEVIYKRGIMSATEGSQAGAKVDVVSGMRKLDKPVFKAMVSTMSANLYGAVPIGDKCVVAVAYRHTLDDIFGGTTFDAYRNKQDSVPLQSKQKESTTGTNNTSEHTREGSSNESRIATSTPKFTFQDLNVNVAGIGPGDISYKLALYGAKDYLDFDKNDSLTANGDKTSYQGGASLHLDKVWGDGSKSEFSSFFSELYSTQNGIYALNRQAVNYDATERVSEFNARMVHNGICKITGLSMGGEIATYRVHNSMGVQHAVQPSLFAGDVYDWGNLHIDAGLRLDMMSSGFHWQPRALLKYRLWQRFTLTTSWGIYNQYLVKDPFLIYANNYQFSWDINTSLKSYNTVAGISYDYGRLNISAEAYLKKIHNSLWVVNNQLENYNFDIKGIDFSAKFNWRHGLLFSSWSYSDDPRQTDGHAYELKAGGILRLYPFTFSVNYVYGDGYNSMLLPTSSYEDHEKTSSSTTTGNTVSTTTSSTISTTTASAYSRMDVFASYEKNFRHFGITLGASVINVFNKENEKYITSWMPRGASSTYYTQAAKFTPVFFAEIKF